MKQYFEEQLANGVPLTIEIIEETIAKGEYFKFTKCEVKKEREDEYRNRVGTFCMYYSLRDVDMDGKVVLRVEKIWSNELETLPEEWVYEDNPCIDRSVPMFQSKAYQDYIKNCLTKNSN